MAGNYIGPPGTVGDGGGRWGTVGDGRGRQGTTENSGKRRKTAEDGGGRRGTVGDDTMSSVLVLAQDGRTAPLRTLCPSTKLTAHKPSTATQSSSVGISVPKRPVGPSFAQDGTDARFAAFG